MLDIRSPNMQGRYIVQENINFDSFLKVMGVTDDTKIEEMIKATKGGVKLNIRDKTMTDSFLKWRN